MEAGSQTKQNTMYLTWGNFCCWSKCVKYEFNWDYPIFSSYRWYVSFGAILNFTLQKLWVDFNPLWLTWSYQNGCVSMNAVFQHAIVTFIMVAYCEANQLTLIWHKVHEFTFNIGTIEGSWSCYSMINLPFRFKELCKKEMNVSKLYIL